MIPLLLALPLAADLPAGWYNPDAVAAASELYHRYADALSPRFEAAQRDLGRGGEALAELELGVLLLGDQASPELQAFYTSTRRHAAHNYLRVQAHVSLLEDDSSATFGAALDRAVEALGARYRLAECTPAAGLAAITGPGATSRSCEGEDLSPALAALMDQDPTLQAAVDEILGIDWPGTTLQTQAMAAVPVGGEDGWVRLGIVGSVLLGKQLEQHTVALERALAPLERGLEAKDPAALAEAQAARAVYEQAIAEDGQALLAALERSLRKQGVAVGVCANPPELGGCPGADRTDELLPRLQSDRKLAKSLR